MLFEWKPKAVFYGWWVVVACTLISLYTGGIIHFGFTAIIEPIVNEFGWSYMQISLAASLRGVEAGLLAPIMGLLVDRWGPRRLMFGGIIIFGLSLVLLSRVASLGVFYAVFLLIAVALSTCSPTVTMTALVNWFRRRLGLALGILASGFTVGGLLIPLVVKLIDLFEWRTAVLIFGLGAWVMILPLSLLVRHKPEQYGYLPDGAVNSSAAITQNQTLGPRGGIYVGMKEILISRPFWHIALAFTYHALVINAVLTHIMPHLSSVGIDRSLSGFIAGFVPLASISGRLIAGWIGYRFEKAWVTAIALGLMGLGVLSLGYVAAGEMWVLVPFLVLFGTGWGMCVIMRAALVNEHFGRSRFGTVHGFVIGVMMLGNITGAPVAGWVFDKWGSYQGIWLAFAVLAVVAVVTILTTPRSKTQSDSLAR